VLTRHTASIVGHIHVAEILLYEVGLHDNQNGLSNTERLELLWSCLNATKAFLANRFVAPLQALHATNPRSAADTEAAAAATAHKPPRFLCLSSFDFMYSFLTGLKLMTLQTPGWDPRQVRAELSFDDLIDRQVSGILASASKGKCRLARHFHDARRDGESLASGVDPLERLARRLAQMKTCLLHELDTVTSVTPSQEPQPPATTPLSGVENMSFDMAATSLAGVTENLMQGFDGESWPELFNTSGWEAYLDQPFTGFIAGNIP